MMHDMVASFWSGDYAPHGYCLLWRRDLILTHLISDILIALAYFSIPVALIRFVRKRDDIAFSGVFWLFAVFILACGMTHVMGAWNLWHGNYGLEGVIKAITAAASVPTAFVLWKILPRALAIPSPNQLQVANQKLSAMVMERDLALGRLELEIQERMKAEEALVQVKKIDAIGQLTGGIAHDFNNLLQAVSGNLELIQRNPDKQGSHERWTTNAMRAVERGAKLAKQLLVFSRVQRLELTRVDVNDVVANMEDLIERSVGPTVELALELSPEPCCAKTEAHQLELAILNLCINARDAMPDGGKVTVRTALLDASQAPAGFEAQPYVRIEVSDTGSGMTAEVASKALDPFFTTKDVGKGTGLGLSMAFGFARQTGGHLEIQTAPGEGSTIIIYLPHTSDAATGQAAAPRIGYATPGLLSPGQMKGTVVVVDDDAEVREIICDMLGDMGYAVRAFSHPQDALDADPPIAADVAVLDYMMPEMSGAVLARHLRRRNPDQAILFVSGYSESAELDQLIDDRARVLRKPFSGADLDAAMVALRGVNGAA